MSDSLAGQRMNDCFLLRYSFVINYTQIIINCRLKAYIVITFGAEKSIFPE